MGKHHTFVPFCQPNIWSLSPYFSALWPLFRRS